MYSHIVVVDLRLIFEICLLIEMSPAFSGESQGEYAKSVIRLGITSRLDRANGFPEFAIGYAHSAPYFDRDIKQYRPVDFKDMFGVAGSHRPGLFENFSYAFLQIIFHELTHVRCFIDPDYAIAFKKEIEAALSSLLVSDDLCPHCYPNWIVEKMHEYVEHDRWSILNAADVEEMVCDLSGYVRALEFVVNFLPRIFSSIWPYDMTKDADRLLMQSHSVLRFRICFENLIQVNHCFASVVASVMSFSNRNIRTPATEDSDRAKVTDEIKDANKRTMGLYSTILRTGMLRSRLLLGSLNARDKQTLEGCGFAYESLTSVRDWQDEAVGFVHDCFDELHQELLDERLFSQYLFIGKSINDAFFVNGDRPPHWDFGFQFLFADYYPYYRLQFVEPIE